MENTRAVVQACKTADAAQNGTLTPVRGKRSGPSPFLVTSGQKGRPAADKNNRENVLMGRHQAASGRA